MILGTDSLQLYPEPSDPGDGRLMHAWAAGDSGAFAAAPAASPVPVAESPAADDDQLPPEAWVERIRDRQETGDGARESLGLLVQRHPQLLLVPAVAGLLDDQP